MTTVGIIGASGNLGSRLTVQACQAFDTVHTYDVAPPQRATLLGIDPNLQLTKNISEPKIAATIEAILEKCTIIHWTAPLKHLDTLDHLPAASLLVLHDSVMANSQAAAHHLRQQPNITGQIGIVHCLTNAERTVVVADSSDTVQQLTDHVVALGLNPKTMSVQQHDTTMAHSQALFAMVCKQFRKDLERYAAEGLLTPSGHRLLVAIEDNESHWTPTTYAAIVTNPAIKPVLLSMLSKLEPN